MTEIRVVCRNEEEEAKVLEIAEKEGYAWNKNVKTTSYPVKIWMCKELYRCTAEDEEPSTDQDSIGNYNIDHAKLCEISQEAKNKIILDFMKKWHEIRRGCAGRSCVNCKFHQFIGEDMICKLCDAGDVGDEERFFNTVKLLIDVVASGDVRILQLTPNEAVEVIRKEIKSLHGKEDDETKGRIEALKMAVRALEEKENGFRAKGD